MTSFNPLSIVNALRVGVEVQRDEMISCEAN